MKYLLLVLFCGFAFLFNTSCFAEVFTNLHVIRIDQSSVFKELPRFTVVCRDSHDNIYFLTASPFNSPSANVENAERKHLLWLNILHSLAETAMANNLFVRVDVNSSRTDNTGKYGYIKTFILMGS